MAMWNGLNFINGEYSFCAVGSDFSKVFEAGVFVHRIHLARQTRQLSCRTVFCPAKRDDSPTANYVDVATPAHSRLKTRDSDYTYSSSRYVAKFNHRQVSPSFYIAHDERQPRSALAPDRGLRRGTRPTHWPVPPRLKSRFGVLRSNVEMNFPGRPTAKGLIRTVLVIPCHVEAHLTPHSLDL
jgi:hypothetical protein